MTQERQIPNLKINDLTKAQLEEAYEEGLVEPDQLWITNDETPASEEWVGENFVKIEDIVNNITSTATNKPLSANMGKELQDQITNLKQRGRYLSIWNTTTGLAETTPTVDPYEYKAGDYFIVGITGATNYKPTGSTYSVSSPSRTVETADVQVNDTYYYDGTTWTLLHSGGGQVTTAFASLAGSPYDNSNLSSALNSKLEGVQINGTDLTIDANKKVNIPIADSTNLGVIKVSGLYGISKTSSNDLKIDSASEAQIVSQSSTYKVITPSNLDIAVREGLGSNSLAWTDAYKQSARNTIGAGTGNTTVNIIDWD